MYMLACSVSICVLLSPVYLILFMFFLFQTMAFFITKKSYSNIKNCVENNATNTFTSCPVSVNRVLQTEFFSPPLLEYFLHPFIWIPISFYLWIFYYKCTFTSHMRVHIVFTCKTLHMKGTFRQLGVLRWWGHPILGHWVGFEITLAQCNHRSLRRWRLEDQRQKLKVTMELRLELWVRSQGEKIVS